MNFSLGFLPDLLSGKDPKKALEDSVVQGALIGAGMATGGAFAPAAAGMGGGLTAGGAAGMGGGTGLLAASPVATGAVTEYHRRGGDGFWDRISWGGR